MQRNRKIWMSLIAAAFAALSLSGTVFAETPAVTMADDTISVTCGHADAGFGTMLYVLSTRAADSDVINQAFLREHLVWVGKASGHTTECVLPAGSPYGAYTVIVGAEGLSDVKSARLAYVLYEEPGIAEEAAAAISKAADADAMAEQFVKYNDRAFMIDAETLNANKDFVFELVKGLSGNADVNAIANCISAAAKFGAMKTMREEEIAQMLTDSYQELGLDEDILLYGDTVAEGTAKEIEHFESIGEIRTYIEELLAITALNHAAPSKFFSVLEKYNALFQVTLSNKLDDLRRYEIEKLLADAEYTDVKKVAEQVNLTIETLYKKYHTGNGGSSAGGSRGGFGGGQGSGSAPVSLTQPGVDEINKTEIGSAAFADIDGYEWAEEAIGALFAQGIVKGDGNGNFRPGDGVTREEFVKILIIALNGGKTIEKSLKFTDVLENAWYKPYIETAFSMGIVTGISEESFGVGQFLTREDAAVMLQRAADATYKDLKKKQTLVNFTDKDSISEYAMVSVDILARAQIFNGFTDGSFRPQNTITRAEIAKVIYNCIEQ